MSKFTFTPDQLDAARTALSKNGITDPAIQDERIKDAQETGRIAMFAYGSLLHRVHTDKGITQSKAFVKNMAARFNQAFTYYGGDAGLPTLMLGMEPMEGEVTHGALQEFEIHSAEDFIDFYNDLQVRENPVNNPIYSFNEVVEVETESGQKVKCISCLSSTNGPLYLGGVPPEEQLTEDEQAYILAHAIGSGDRLDNGTFRETGNVQFADLQAHHKTGAAYVYHYLDSYRKWGFPENAYLERLVKKINRIRQDMVDTGRDIVTAAENSGDRPDGLSPRFEEIAEDRRETPEQVAWKYIAANDKLHNILMKNDAYPEWRPEWRAPDPHEAFEQT